MLPDQRMMGHQDCQRCLSHNKQVDPTHTLFYHDHVCMLLTSLCFLCNISALAKPAMLGNLQWTGCCIATTTNLQLHVDQQLVGGVDYASLKY